MRPLLRRLCPGVLAALARSRSALIACGVVGAPRLDGIGLVAGPPRGVLPVPGVRISGVFRLPGVGPALAARRKGVLGCKRAVGVAAVEPSGDERCFLRADSDMVSWSMSNLSTTSLVDSHWGNASVDATAVPAADLA
jgi:hypothetical protein